MNFWKKMPYWLKGVLVIIILFLASELMGSFFSWKSPLFSSTNYEVVLNKAIETKNPLECEKLAKNLGDFEPRSNCYSESIFAIGDVSMCSQYPVNELTCRWKIAVKKSDISLCEKSDLNNYNYCIYKVAAGNLNSAICDSVKKGTNYSQDRCLLGIIEDNMKNIPSKFSVQVAQQICNDIHDKQLKDYCLGNIIIISKDASLCPMINDTSNLNGTLATDICK